MDCLAALRIQSSLFGLLALPGLGNLVDPGYSQSWGGLGRWSNILHVLFQCGVADELKPCIFPKKQGRTKNSQG